MTSVLDLGGGIYECDVTIDSNDSVTDVAISLEEGITIGSAESYHVAFSMSHKMGSWVDFVSSTAIVDMQAGFYLECTDSLGNDVAFMINATFV